MSKNRILPTLNYTEVNETLTDIELNGFKGQSKEVPARFFPRWNALSKIRNLETNKLTSAVMVAGDSKLETQIGMSKGFPEIELGQDEVIMLDDMLEVLGLKPGDTFEIQFDLFQSAVAQLAKFKQVLFKFKDYASQTGDESKQSEAFMKLLEMDTEYKFDPSEFLNEEIINSLMARFPLGQKKTESSIIVNAVLGFLKGKEEAKMQDVLAFVLPYLREEDFILKKKYKVRAGISSVYGKWPQTFGNAFFIDSQFLLQDVYDMTRDNI
jgi:hypothetical protein